MKRWGRLLLEVLSRWMRADGFGLAGSMSFYTLFSLAPMMAFAMLTASRFLGEEDARKAATDWLQGFLSQDEAIALIKLFTPVSFATEGWLLAVVSGLTLFWAATLVFVRLRISVNALLEIRSEDVRQAVKHSLLGRVNAFAFTLVFGLLITGGILLSATAPKIVPLLVPGADPWTRFLVNAINALVMFLGCAAILRLLPVRAPSWRSILVGCTFVLVAFEVGRLLVNLYLARSQIASAYGAASTLVVFLLWIYYSAQMLLFGVTLAGALDGPMEETPEARA